MIVWSNVFGPWLRLSTTLNRAADTSKTAKIFIVSELAVHHTSDWKCSDIIRPYTIGFKYSVTSKEWHYCRRNLIPSLSLDMQCAYLCMFILNGSCSTGSLESYTCRTGIVKVSISFITVYACIYIPSCFLYFYNLTLQIKWQHQYYTECCLNTSVMHTATRLGALFRMRPTDS